MQHMFLDTVYIKTNADFQIDAKGVTGVQTVSNSLNTVLLK